MADLSITASLVALGGPSVQIEKVVAGEAVTQMQPVYLKTSDSKYWRTDADAAASAVLAGVALTPAAADGYFILLRAGPIIVGATVVVGLGYYISTTPGGIAVIADLLSGDFPSFVGFAISATVIQVSPITATVAKA